MEDGDISAKTYLFNKLSFKENLKKVIYVHETKASLEALGKNNFHTQINA